MYIFIDLNIYLSVYLYVCLPVYLSVISFVLPELWINVYIKSPVKNFHGRAKGGASHRAPPQYATECNSVMSSFCVKKILN